MQSRYYDPVTHRFINADGLVSTGTGVLGHNMFAYCDNNPTNRSDTTGCFWSEAVEFVKAVGNAIKSFSTSYAVCGGIAALDGPFPYGDAIALVGAACITVAAVGYGIYITANSWSVSFSAAKEKEYVSDSRSAQQAYFPANPYAFAPRGLIMTEYPGTTNGRIIKWHDPVSNICIFEWNEDFKNGAHYHAMMIEWDGAHFGPHYSPGDLVPEPWNSLYFGG